MIGRLVTWGLAISRREELDELIADGRPGSTPRLFKERSRQLVKPTRRMALAEEIEGIVDLAITTPIRDTGQMPVGLIDLRVAEVRAARSELCELAQALRSAEPPPARGVALAILLMHDAQSPLYVRHGPGDLVQAVTVTTAALSGPGRDR